MTYKVLDTCCVISLFNEISSCDILFVCRDYKLTISDHVMSELIRPIPSIKSLNTIQLSTIDKTSLFNEISNTFPGLGQGEVSAFTLSVCLNETEKEQIVFVTDDKKAIRKLDSFRKQKDVLNRFPKIGGVLIVKLADVIKYLFTTGKIDKTVFDAIMFDLSP